MCVDNKCICDRWYTSSLPLRHVRCNVDTRSSKVKKDYEINSFTELFILIIGVYVLATSILYTCAIIFTTTLIVSFLLWCFGFISNQKMIKLVKKFIIIRIFVHIFSWFDY